MSWQSRFGGLAWRVTPDGVETLGSGGPLRTRGEPRTMRFYWATWAAELLVAARDTGVPVALLLQIIATENGPAAVDENQLHVLPPRKEPGYVDDEATPHRISVGPTHILISTARAAMGEASIDRRWLLEPRNNIRAAATYVASHRAETGFDPILVGAAYNAGGIYEAVPGRSRWGNRWHLRTYGNHLDRAAAWYGDACAMIQETHALTSYDLGGLARVGVRAA